MSKNKAQHTPGPWKAIQLPPNETWKAQGHVEADGKPIAMTARIEDARLIAAAPELLEACEEIIRGMISGPNSTTKNVTHYAIKKVQAAISKAKGGKA